MKYLVSTRKRVVERIIPPVVMVDGTVPGWEPRVGDLHFDHHRHGGADVQILEIIDIPMIKEAVFVTTQVDADACTSAAFLQMSEDERSNSYRKLLAISYDCDHLAVPDYLSDLSDFASKAVVALKSNSSAIVKRLGLNENRKKWTVAEKERFASRAFELGTLAILDACRDIAPWPGERDEDEEAIASYWKDAQQNVDQILNQNLIILYKGCLLFDAKQMGTKYVDPRCWFRAVALKALKPEYPVALTQREVYIDNNAFAGYSYTIGVIPFHPKIADVDFTLHVFEALTEAERQKFPGAEGWGGRRTVGGSGWNTPSRLSPKEVIDIVVMALAL